MPVDFNKSIFVSRPALPPLNEFEESLKEIWSTRIITNNGPFVQQFEERLKQYLGVKYISVFTNGTIALMAALHVLDIKGEVITTPFTFAATPHSVYLRKAKPVFADIDPDDFTLDPEKVRKAITPETTAILPVYVFGNPCHHQQLKEIADSFNLKLIYDAAHAFGIKTDGSSILEWGDISVLSFHATKVFTTFEGGAVICHDPEIKSKIERFRNFGIVDEITVKEPGINAKMNELQAALGLLQLNYIEEYISKRKLIAEQYKHNLDSLPGVHSLKNIKNIRHNYSHFPLLIDQGIYGRSRDEIYKELKKHNIFARRYFYPLISHFIPYSDLPSATGENLPVAEKIAEQILCLPIYPDLPLETVDSICNLIKNFSR